MNRILLFAATLASATAAPVYHDVVVYGGTSGGVVAATQVAMSGKSVVLISPTRHLGGLSGSGLGATDLGNVSILGGLTREFYHRIYQLYVREARRMVSDYVMSQANCAGTVVAPDCVGLAAYAMDSHHVQRHVKDGRVKNEGDVQMTVSKPYPVAYRAIIPKRGECPNLLVPWSLSATHMAFGSIRMEPVFMGLSQAAAIAASLAIDRNIAVQDLAYTALRPALLTAGLSLGDPVP